MRAALLHACVSAFVLTAVAIGPAQDKGTNTPPVAKGGPHSVTLNWDRPKQGSSVTAFNVYRADASKRAGKISCTEKFEKIAVVKTPETSYRDTKVVSTTSYCYAITAVSPRGESSHSTRVVATVP